MRPFNLTILSFLITGFVTLLAPICNGQNVFREYAMERPIGDYEFTDCNTGVKRSTYDPLNEGKVLYVAKMATWCPYCKDNTKANFNKDKVAALLEKYKDKLEVWLMFDGPTDCNGAKATQDAVNLKGANVFLAVDNNDVDSKFYSSGTPTILVIDPITKRSVFQNWEYSSSFSSANATLDSLLKGSYTFPKFGTADNIVQFKEVQVSSTRSNNEFANSRNYVTDGKLGTAWGSDLGKAQGAWCTIDLGQKYQITGVQMRIGTSMDSKKIKIQLADSESGPWDDISELQPFNTQLKFKIASTRKGRYFRVLNSEANSGFVLSIADLIVNGTPEIPANVESADSFEATALYPNPAKEFFYVNCTKTVRMQIFNDRGILHSEQDVPSGESKIDVQGFVKGAYLVRFNRRNYVQTSKIVIE